MTWLVGVAVFFLNPAPRNKTWGQRLGVQCAFKGVIALGFELF